MSEPTVALIETATGQTVQAELALDLGAHDLDEIEKVWGPLRRDAARKIVRQQGPQAVPQHWLWDWRRKSPLLKYPTFRCLGIRYGGQYQGVVMVNADTHQTKLVPDTGKPLMYIEFLEAAPWNNAKLNEKPLLSPIGPRLVEMAVRLSLEEGFHGRIGLHSLPQSEKFYTRCGMTPMETDSAKQNLRYYEMTREQAKTFLAPGGRP